MAVEVAAVAATTAATVGVAASPQVAAATVDAAAVGVPANFMYAAASG